tara:strand:- start:3835 stop:3948 length:114 start_codon:yes stop_codon:yes gene_type:complete
MKEIWKIKSNITANILGAAMQGVNNANAYERRQRIKE